MADSPSGTARECKRASVGDASSSSSSSSVSPSKRRKESSPVGGDSESQVVASSSVSELACSAVLSLTVSPEEVDVEAARSPATSFLGSGGHPRFDLPASSAPLSSFDHSSGEVVEQILLVEDHLREEKSLETETSSACINVYFRSRCRSTHGGKSSSLFKGTMKQERSAENNGRNLTPEASGRRMVLPPQAEIEEFFSAAEKYEQKRFTEKYNYDVVKDVPLEGRYQWVRLNP